MRALFMILKIIIFALGAISSIAIPLIIISGRWDKYIEAVNAIWED